MNDFFNWFLVYTSWLYTKIIVTPYFFFDLWSFMHLLSGILIMLSLFALNYRHKFLILTISLLAWEIAEIVFIKIWSNSFLLETLPDQITDVVLGVITGLVTFWFIKNHQSFKKIKYVDGYLFASIISAFTIAFIWVGSYHYHYSIAEFNSPGINYSAFIFWFFGYFAIITFYRILEQKISKIIYRILIYWSTYFVVLFILEYLGHYVFELKEVSSPLNYPMIFGLIHGNAVLHTVYCFAPITAICVFLPLRKLVTSAVKAK